jgi:TolA-binding protein
MGETAKGREALLTVATKYPDSPMADDALYHVGKSYEDESQRLAGLTRVVTEQIAQETAQKEAYQFVQQQRDVNRKLNTGRIESLKKGGKSDLAELEEARQAGNEFAWNTANFDVALSNAAQVAQSLSAAQLADRQDKINAALRKAVENYATAAKVPGGDKAGDALLRMAVIYDEQLKDSQAALATWQEIVRQFSGTAVAEEASWRIAQYYERAVKWTEAVEAYKAFLRNYRGSPKAAQAQFSIAEGYEHLNKWVEAMDAYSNFINNFADNPLAQKAKEQINWIKTYRL